MGFCRLGAWGKKVLCSGTGVQSKSSHRVDPLLPGAPPIRLSRSWPRRQRRGAASGRARRSYLWAGLRDGPSRPRRRYDRVEFCIGAHSQSPSSNRRVQAHYLIQRCLVPLCRPKRPPQYWRPLPIHLFHLSFSPRSPAGPIQRRGLPINLLRAPDLCRVFAQHFEVHRTVFFQDHSYPSIHQAHAYWTDRYTVEELSIEMMAIKATTQGLP